MKAKLCSLLILLAAAFSAPAAAVDYFLKIDGIDGEASDPVHGGAIEIVSWSWGETQPGLNHGSGGGGTGKVAMQDFHFTMKVNKATPKLMLACARGQHIPQAVLTCRKAGATPGEPPFEFFTVTLSDLLISSFQTGGSSGDVVPTDQISLNFTKVKYDYTVQATGERVEAEYDSTADGDPTGAP